MIKVALIGYGFSGRVFHAPIIRAVEGLCLTTVVKRSGDGVISALPDVRVVRSIDELLADDETRLVVIATPNATHFEIAKRCLVAGKDVVIDKPFAVSVSEGDELKRLAAEKERVLTSYQNRRWDGDFSTVRSLIEKQTLGRIVVYESRFDRYRRELRPDAWREKAEAGSGVWFDLGVHLVDQALQLFGVPQAISADIRREREGAVVDDAFDVTLHYPGMRTVVGATMLASARGPRFVLHGTNGSYVKFGLDPQQAALIADETPGGDAWGQERRSAWGTLTLNGDEAAARQIPTEAGDYRRFYENVRDVILGMTQLEVTPEQALNVLRVIELARESSERGCVVKWKR